MVWSADQTFWRLFTSGSRTSNVVPGPPVADEKPTVAAVPLDDLASPTASPMPKPPRARSRASSARQKRMNTRSRSSSEMPMPVSADGDDRLFAVRDRAAR